MKFLFDFLGTTALLPSVPGVTTNPLANSFSSALPLTHIPQPMYASPFQQGITPIATAAPRPAMFPQIIYWYPTPPVSPQTYFTTNTGPSMVVMRGLPFNVSLQDILNFFQGFPEVRPLPRIQPSILRWLFLALSVSLTKHVKYRKETTNIFKYFTKRHWLSETTFNLVSMVCLN